MSSANQVRASHTLIKHRGSRRKSLWKDPEGAVSHLKGRREDVVSGTAQFEDLAACHSDCSSAKRGGDLEVSDSVLSIALEKKDNCGSRKLVFELLFHTWLLHASQESWQIMK